MKIIDAVFVSICAVLGSSLMGSESWADKAGGACVMSDVTRNVGEATNWRQTPWMKLARNQANASQATFGQLREAFQPSRPVAAKEAIFIVADEAKRLINYQPAIGDKDTETYWTAEQAMLQLDAILPPNFSGDVYVAARRTATPRSDVDFARTFRQQLVSARRSAGKVYGLASASLGPIPKPGDTRWLEAV